MNLKRTNQVNENFRLLLGRGNRKANYALILGIAALLCGVLALGGYSAYTGRQTSSDVSGMVSNLLSMQDNLFNLKESVSENMAVITSTESTNKESYTKELEKIDKQIVTTTDEITMLISELENADSSSLNELYAKYENITGGVTNVTDNINSFNSQISRELLELKTDSKNNHSETIAKLETITSDLSSQNSNFEISLNQNFSQMDQSFKTMQEENTYAFSNLEEVVSAGNDELKNQIDEMRQNQANSTSSNSAALSDMNDSMSYQFMYLSNSVSENNANYNERFNAIDNRLDQVFQRASDGKLKLQNTIAGLNIDSINISETEVETFEKIDDEIKKIYAAGYSDGVASIGTPSVHYDYHQHKHDDGSDVNEEESDQQDTGEGCFREENIHRHDESSDCYQKVGVCGGHQSCTKSGEHSTCSVRCSRCGNTFSVSHKSSYPDTCTKAKYEYVCGYLDGELIGYYPACGFKNGEIERAIIEYK